MLLLEEDLQWGVCFFKSRPTDIILSLEEDLQWGARWTMRIKFWSVVSKVETIRRLD